MKFGLSKSINKDHKKLLSPGPDKAVAVAHDAPKMMKSTDKPVKDCLVTQHDNPNMLAEKHNDEKLAITFLIMVAGLTTFLFW